MASYLLKRSDEENKRPLPATILDGELVLNYAPNSPGLFTKASDGSLMKLGPAAVGAEAPNSDPAPGGATGNCRGEIWLDTSGADPILKVFTGESFQGAVPDPLVGVTNDSTTQLGVTTGPRAGTNTVYVGYNAGLGSTSNELTAVGSLAASSCGANGTSAVAVGFKAANAATNITKAVIVGSEAGATATNLQNCVAVGYQSLYANSGSDNTAVGTNSLIANTTGSRNTAIGDSALKRNTVGNDNTSVGNGTFSILSSGSENSALGSGAGSRLQVGTGNTFIGSGAGMQQESSYNTVIGWGAGANGFDENKGSYNVLIGYACATLMGNASYNTVIGSYNMGNLTGSKSGNVILSDGNGNVRFRANSSGAWSPNGVDFGNAGQVLKSNGSTAAPSWSNLATGTSATFTSFDNKVVTIVNGLITAIQE